MEGQYTLHTLLSASGNSVHQMAIGSNPADLYGHWAGDDVEDLLFCQDTSLSGQFVAHWELRIMVQEGAVRGIANGKLRRPLEYNKSFDCAEVEVGDSALLFLEPLMAKARPVGAARL